MSSRAGSTSNERRTISSNYSALDKAGLKEAVEPGKEDVTDFLLTQVFPNIKKLASDKGIILFSSRFLLPDNVTRDKRNILLYSPNISGRALLQLNSKYEYKFRFFFPSSKKWLEFIPYITEAHLPKYVVH